jgi:hypothetical protein
MNLLKKIKQKIVDKELLRMLELYKEKKWHLILVDSNYEIWKISFKKQEDCSNKLKEIK